MKKDLYVIFLKFYLVHIKGQQELSVGAQTSSSHSVVPPSRDSRKRKTLEDLFRPPIDLMFKGSFHSVSYLCIINLKHI